MAHQEIADFVIDVFEAGIYRTNVLAGIRVERDWPGWTLTFTDGYWGRVI